MTTPAQDRQTPPEPRGHPDCQDCHDTGLIVGMGNGRWIAGDEWNGDECVEMQDCLCREGEDGCLVISQCENQS